MGRAALCLLGFAFVALALHILVPWEPFIPSYSERLDFFRERTERFSTVFLGSSRIRAHVNPRVLDRHLGGGRAASRSFNFGVDALSLIELNSLVDEIIRLDPPALRYALIEPVFSTNLPWENVATTRSIYFHDLANAGLEIRCNLSLPAMRSTIWRSLLSTGYHLSNLGRLADLTSPPGSARTARLPLKRLRDHRGFQAQDTLTNSGLHPWRRDFLDRRDEMEVMMEGNRSLAPGERFDLPCHFDAVIAMAAKLRQAGIQPVFLHTPGFAWVKGHLSFEEYLRESGDPTPMLSYIGGNDDLYLHDLWFDPRHLKGSAAEEFTRRLADDLAGLFPESAEL